MSQLYKHVISVSCLYLGSVALSGAAVMHFPDQNIPIPTTFAGVSVDLEFGLVNNDLAGFTGGDANFLLGGLGITNDADEDAITPSWQPVRFASDNTSPIVNLGIGAIVSGGSPLGTSFGASGGTNSHFATFTSGASGYIGFQLVLDDTSVVNGWMEVTLQDDNTPGVIHQWAFEDSGNSIRVAEIPEPSHAMLSIFGLAALGLRRRREAR